jgi:hypothetical protein
MASDTQRSVPTQLHTLQLYANRLRDELASVEQAIADLANPPAPMSATNRLPAA